MSVSATKLGQHRDQPYEIERQQVGGTPQSWFVVRCSRCPAVERIHMHVSLTPEAVKHKFRNRDWAIDPRHADGHLCPKCRRAPKPQPPEPKPMAQNVTPLPAAAVRDATPFEMRRIFALIEGHFDETKGCYLGGWSDDRVAKDLNLPRALIAKVRDESGLKIKGNPELLALKDECATLRDMLTDVEGRIGKLEARGG